MTNRTEIEDHETQRLAALARYDVMDTPREPSFDELAALTARLCDAPIAVVNLVGKGRQFFKAEVGLGVRETPLESSFCAHALLEQDFLIVPDLSKDARFDCNPLVTGAPHIRAYAGALLKTEDGMAIGTLCVLDYRVRDFSDLQREALGVLARQVMAQLDLRRTVEQLDRRNEALRAGEARLRLILDSARDYAIIATDTQRRITSWSAGAEAIFEWTEAQAHGRPIDDLFLPEDRAAGVPEQEIARAETEGYAPDVRWHCRADGSLVFLNGSTHPIRDGDGRIVGFLKVGRNETEDRARAAELARTRIELVDSEDRFRNMADHAPVMMWVTDADGACTYLNRRWYEYTGQTREEALGHGWLNATHPDDKAEAGHIFGQANTTHTPFRIDYRLRRADGSYGWAIDAASPRFGPDGEFLGYIGSVIDIADRRAAEDALRHANALLAAVMEAVPGVVYAKDGAGRMLAANRGTRELVGKPLDAIIGRTDLEFLDDRAQAEAVMANDRRVMSEGRMEVLEEQVSLPDGTCAIWLSTKAPFRDAAGRVVGLVGSSIDITERKRAEEALRCLNETLEDEIAERTAERDRMWDTSPDLMLILDFNGIVRRVNPAWTTLLGYDEAELVGHHVNEFVLAEDHADTIGAYERAARGGLLEIENRCRHKDGSIRWISWNAAPAGVMTYATGRDVTAEKDQAAALAQAEEQLRQAQKMEAVGQLTGGIAHDFNNLLTAVTGGLELLAARLANGEYDRLGRYITMAQTGANRAAALTQRLLAFSRRQTLDPKPTDTDRLIAGMQDIIVRTIGPAIVVKVVPTPGLWPILVDAPQLESALLNLCINARDAMPEGGTLTIETSNKTLDARAAAAQDLPAGDYVSLCVTDTGTGMPPEVMERVFDPFFTTKPIGEGTGLGLSMIYGFVRQSGGQVRIYSEVGMGTTMRLYLPRLSGEHDLADLTDTVAARHRAHDGQTVLLVEDEAAIRELVSEVLRDSGYRVLTASDGPMGVSLLQSNVRIDLLVTDVGLPGGLNGRQVADAGRAVRPDLKVLFVTGYAANAAVGAGHLEKGMEVLTKPFNVLELERRVGEILSA
ncbi:PAS domain S-box protein [Sphingomonas fuzhouensis]|uniref:PAS domain S-box protein n=1 Tax=Sphingomonas fuzhouensis TaxID=3106033 RepID=UPI002AFE212D|nr:PAS domain S-box protein [Sphingomonas sp. SGZ-02]